MNRTIELNIIYFGFEDLEYFYIVVIKDKYLIKN